MAGIFMVFSLVTFSPRSAPVVVSAPKAPGQSGAGNLFGRGLVGDVVFICGLDEWV
jgi:hypothetical protein